MVHKIVNLSGRINIYQWYMYLASRQLSLFQIENWVCSHFLLHFVFGDQDRVHFTANLLSFLKSFCNVSFMISKLQDLIWNLLIQCISSDAKIFWILEQRVPPLFYIAWLSYQIGCVHLNVFWTCVWRKKKNFGIWD